MSLTNVAGDVAFSAATPLTATANGPVMSLPQVGTSNAVFIGIHTSAVTGTSPTLAVKLQDSADGSTFADVTGAATAANITAAGNVVLFGRSLKQFVRVVATVGGTSPSFTTNVVVAGASV